MSLSRNAKRIVRMVIIDSLALAAALLIFAFFHHVRKSYFDVIEPTSVAQPTAAPVAAEAEAATPEPAQEQAAATTEATTDETAAETAAETTDAEATPEPTAVPTGLLQGNYADKFSYTGTVSDATSYRSSDVAVELITTEAYSSVIHILDIYIQDLSSFRTYVPRNEGSSEKTLMPIEADTELGGVVCITSGDQFYGHNDMGYIIRNGLLYNSTKTTGTDVLVLYDDGTMKTFSSSEFDPDTEVAKGVQQTWSFGPALLDSNGNPIDSFTSSVAGRNPRMAIGYYEPGHYCLVEVDGARNSDNSSSKGLTLSELSYFMQGLGCKVAYNLDGGATAGMVFQSTKINSPGRRAYDLIYICEPNKD